MRLIVTGAAGFIGRHLSRQLAHEGHAVIALDRWPPAESCEGIRADTVDLLDREALIRLVQRAEPEGLVHLAARTDLRETRDLDGYAANMAGVENLIAAMRATPSLRRAVCTSTQLVSGVGVHPRHDEDFGPTTLYGESKVRTERIWRAADGGGVEWCIVRPTTIWGPGMNPHYLRFFAMIRDGRYFHIGGGPTYKSYGYVENTVHQYVALMTAPGLAVHRRTFYLADYEPLALEAWADAFAEALGAPRIRTLPRWVARAVARGGDVIQAMGAESFPFTSFRLRNVLTPYRADLEPTRAVCGALPVSMQEGVARTVRWLREVWSASGQQGTRQRSTTNGSGER